MTAALLLTSLAALLTALMLIRIQRRRRIRGERPAIVMRQLQARIAVLREELATERMRVVACGAAANGIRSPESSPYWSPSHADVCRLADRAAAQADLLAAPGEGSCAIPAHLAAARGPLSRPQHPSKRFLGNQGFTPTPELIGTRQNSLHRGTAPTTQKGNENERHQDSQDPGPKEGA